eukprot:CAMPEP_0181058864 /NCGR_PEP_ID=MMETSP1070-20121207/21063_1 /TAXON_ID=265543 /ORGANISM="Minutocellus polymorphus, Strain NH13" /LENGTH=42 /DNA_ID= /DNA_START= /DNA_END= /DNA_ORIENTATION=
MPMIENVADVVVGRDVVVLDVNVLLVVLDVNVLVVWDVLFGM